MKKIFYIFLCDQQVILILNYAYVRNNIQRLQFCILIELVPASPHVTRTS